MKIHKYRGRSEQEVIRQIKEELGPSAIILNVKTLESSWLSKIFSKENVEIIAATDEVSLGQNQRVERIPEVKPDVKPDVRPDVRVDKAAEISKPDLIINALQDQMSSMERLLESTASKMENFYKESLIKEFQQKQASSSEKPETNRSKMENLIYEHLVKQEVKEEVARDLLKGTEKLGDNPQIKAIIRVVYNNISKAIGQGDVITDNPAITKGPQVMFFIGPTGVGKTTSIAKLTADLSLKKEKDVALVTADTYRIAAIDQLRTYSEILSVPLKVVYSAEELKAGIGEFKDKEYIFIDTAGRSHKNEAHVEELKEMLDMLPEKKVYLVLSATTKFTDLMSIIKRYTKLCSEYSIIITKTDETISAGTILNLKYFTGKPLSYVSFGQNVPDDIEIIDGGKYAKILLGSLGDE